MDSIWFTMTLEGKRGRGGAGRKRREEGRERRTYHRE